MGEFVRTDDGSAMPSAPGRSESALTREGAGGAVVPEMDGKPRGAMLAPVMARAISAVVFGGFCLVALFYVVDSGATGNQVVLATALLAVLLGLQVLYFSRPGAAVRGPLGYL